MIRRLIPSLAVLSVAFSASAHATAFMGAQWAAALCEAWNKSDTLTTKLAGSWIKNDAKRGYKIIQLYRTKCGAKSRVELDIAEKNGKAECIYGGAVKHPKLNDSVDYLMHATDEDWTCMGEGKFGCGAMGAMMTGKLKFEGPKLEAMGAMGPFDSFLLLTGKVPGDKASCP